jgi:hypothetical protein
LKALVEVIQVLEILTPNIEEIIDDWETLLPLHSFETTLESHNDIIVIDTLTSSSKTLTGALPTLKETLDFEQLPTSTQSLNQLVENSPRASSLQAMTIS